MNSIPPTQAAFLQRGEQHTKLGIAGWSGAIEPAMIIETIKGVDALFSISMSIKSENAVCIFYTS